MDFKDRREVVQYALHSMLGEFIPYWVGLSQEERASKSVEEWKEYAKRHYLPVSPDELRRCLWGK